VNFVSQIRPGVRSPNGGVRIVGPLKRALAKSVLAIIGACLGLALGEIGLRVAGIKYDGSFYIRDSVRGWALRPDSEGWWVSEGRAYVRINHDGMHDREHTIAKPPGTFRIAVLGDSLTAARQVPLEKNFCSVIELELSQCAAFAGRRVEVMNFGVDGYGTAQELLTLRDHVWKYRPDLVVLAFYPGNDVYNNNRRLNPMNASYTPYFVLHGNDLVLDNSFRDVIAHNRQLQLGDLLGGLVNHVRLLQMLNTYLVRHVVVRQEHRKAYNERFAKFGSNYEQCLIYSPPTEPEMQEAWKVTEDLLVMMRDEVRAHGAKLLVAVCSIPFQVSPDPATRQADMKLCGVDTFFYPDNRLQAFGERNAIPVVALGPDLSAYAERNKVYLHGFTNTHLGTGHLNEAGHLMTGKLIAAYICTQGEVDSQRPPEAATRRMGCAVPGS
jgi:hypothetical protein